MATNTRPGQIPAWQRQAWLTEYQVCQQHNDHIGHEVWLSTTIFLTINVTLLGGLFYTIITRIVLDNPDLRSISSPIQITFIVLTAIGFGMVLILGKWVDWLKRMRFRAAINFARMGEIEPFLGMRKATMCRELDRQYDRLKTSDSVTREWFQLRAKHFKHFRASGFDGLMYIANLLIVVWFLSTLVLWAVLIVSLITSA